MVALITTCRILLCLSALPLPAVLAIDSGLTSHFRLWLSNNGFNAAALARDDLAGGASGGSFGGRRAATDRVTRDPVIFVHGNSDRALGGEMGGWTKAVAYFESRGYSSAELYASTWGPADKSKAREQTHSFAYVSHIRQFILAVLRYTGARKVDIVSHSMGVTLARKAIKGGLLDGQNLGEPLTSRVDTFVGMAGGNYGLTNCFLAPLLKTCNSRDGFYPGVFNPLLQQVTGRSRFLNDMLQKPGFEGAHRYAIWSVDDELLTLGCIVYTTVTCRFPGMTAEKRLTGVKHLEVKNAYNVYYRMVTDHVVP
ncbi:hypothetical protein BOX15_Mlig027840g1 [Macrostomum lignano]|uniref:Uncharacterized protein n=2 Tax=Macrostomum lignano TaxID=282301 RepID=A0A267EYY4_9PLAT|nr:hypothetical protein BOX15_Mlig027840g2 [Macrostomum lignano]PAA70992.1 hypothetical protein BOX15_Mlig027840g1 [Macrostomum lignano]